MSRFTSSSTETVFRCCYLPHHQLIPSVRESIYEQVKQQVSLVNLIHLNTQSSTWSILTRNNIEKHLYNKNGNILTPEILQCSYFTAWGIHHAKISLNN